MGEKLNKIKFVWKKKNTPLTAAPPPHSAMAWPDTQWHALANQLGLAVPGWPAAPAAPTPTPPLQSATDAAARAKWGAPPPRRSDNISAKLSQQSSGRPVPGAPPPIPAHPPPRQCLLAACPVCGQPFGPSDDTDAHMTACLATVSF